MAELEYYPPTLVLEALLQTGGILARASAPGRRTVLGKVERAVFPALARPGDQIQLEARIELSRPEGTLCTGVAQVGDRVVAEARFMIVLLSPEVAPLSEEQRAYRRKMLDALGVPRMEEPGGTA